MSVSRKSFIRFFLLAAISGMLASPLFAAVIYVDNQVGDDAFDGIAQTAASNTSGPTRTIRRALEIARRADIISVKNTGTPYYESIRLAGQRLSGFGGRPLILISDGAVIDGSKAVPDLAWENAGGNVWRIKLWRKGYFQLLLDGKAVPGTITPRTAKTLPEIAVGQWTAWKGAIYYHSKPFDSPLGKSFRFAYRRVGLSMYNVKDVDVRGFTFRGFQLDGVNIHDLCERIQLENLSITANARAGVAVGGTSAVLLKTCQVKNNRLHSVLVTELAGLKSEKSDWDKPPTLPKP